MGLDFTISLKNKSDSKKYFKAYPEMKKFREEWFEDKDIWWNCGRNLSEITFDIAKRCEDEDPNNDYKRKVKLGKLKEFADILDRLNSMPEIIAWAGKDYSLDYYEQKLQGLTLEEHEKYDATKLWFDDLSKFEGIDDHTVEVIRAADHKYLDKLEKKLDAKIATYDKFCEALLDVYPLLNYNITDFSAYMFTTLMIFKTIKNCLELFGEDYEVFITWSN